MTKAAELAKMGEVLTNSQIGGRRNIVINGAMQCSQRSTSETGQHTSGYLTLDRFNFNFVNEDELRTTLTQASEGPDGFANSLKVQATTAESAVGANHEFRVIYKVEAQDLQQLKFGTSAAERITVSFYVRSSVAATYGFNLFQNDASKINGQAYTINSANTWERKTLTFIGNTSDVINDDNGIGMQLNWFLMAGSNFTSGSNSGWETFAAAKHAVGHNANAVVTTTNATWQITGVQLEVGSQATPFEHRSFGEELGLCMRYYEHDDSEGSDNYRISFNKGTTGEAYYFAIDYAVTKRAKPTTTVTQAYSDNIVFSVHSGSSGRKHMGLASAASGSTDTRALFECTWTADAEL
jgi:hypothetical protein